MRPRHAALLVLTLLLASPLATAVPADDGPSGGAGSTAAAGPLLYLKAGTFDPVVDPAPGPTGLRASSTHPLYVVQFDGPIQRAWREAMADAGVDLLDYVPDYGYFALVPARALEDVRGMEHVRYVGPAHLAYRVDPHLWSGEVAAVDLTAVAWSPGAANRLAVALMREGAHIYGQADEFVNFRASPLLAIALARDPGMAVAWIEPHFWPQPHLDNDARSSRARQQSDGVYQSNDASAWSYNSATDEFEGWTGENVTVTVADSGLDDSHPAFDGRIVAYYDYGQDGQADYHGHGTHCAGIVLGDGDWRSGDTGVDGKYSGIAPEAGLVVQELLYGYVSLTQANREASRSGATISSNSWGSGYFGNYDSTCIAYDDDTRDSDNWKQGDQPMLFSFSAGNEGGYGSNTVTPPATAKNVITVGATGNDKWGVSSNTVASFSSQGPCDDGRLKPDVVMPGHQVVSAQSNDPYSNQGWYKPADGQDSYVFASGTSMAAPGVAGAAAVVTQFLVESEGMTDPSPAMLKASLINGARPLSGYTYPGHVQGWGKVDLVNTLFETGNYRIYRDDQSVELDTETGVDKESYWFMVGSDQPLKVTLVWTDQGGSGSTGKALINDLDLEIIAPDGTRYAGNLFESDQSVADTAFYNDRLNNVEGFLLSTPAQGIWTINVKCFNAPEGPQDFALVVSGNVEKGHVDLAPTALTPSPRDLEEFHTATLTATVKNLGNRVAAVFDYKVEQVDPDGVVTVLDEANSTDLGPGQQTQMSWSFTGKRGTHKLRLTLDPRGVLPESDEANNVMEVEYFFKGFDVRISLADGELLTDPGKLVEFNLTVRNRGNVADEFRVSITSAPPGWSAQLIADTFQLDAGQATPVAVTVIPPSNATAGEVCQLTFTATSMGNSSKSRFVTLRTEVNQIFGLHLTAPVDHLDLLPGEEGDFTLRVENPGNGPDTYEVLLPSGIDAGWWPSIPEPYVELTHRSSGDAVFRLASPNPSSAGTSISFDLTVVSRRSGMEASVTLTARVSQFFENSYQVTVREDGGEVGTHVTVPVTIENKGNGPVEYTLAATATAPSWRAAFGSPTVTIPGYGWTEVEMSFTVPSDAEAATHELSIAVIPTGGDVLRHNFTFTVLQFHDLELSVLSGPATVTQGEDLTVKVLLDNRGNGPEDFKLVVPDLPAFWSFDLEGPEPVIGPFGELELALVVHTNRDTPGGDYQVGLDARYGPAPQASSQGTVGVTILTRPDLQVVQGLVSASSVDVMENDLVTFQLQVLNSGGTPAKEIYVQVLVDGAPYGQPLYIDHLGPGGTTNLTSSWTANVTGLHEISVQLDSTDEVDETREDNNRASLQVNVNKLDYQTSPGMGMLAALLAVAALAVLGTAARRRRR